MTTTLLDLKYKSLTLCGEDYDPSSPVLAPGGGGSATVTLTSALTGWANDCLEAMTRTCLYIRDIGTANITTGNYKVAFSALTTTTSGAQLWAVETGGVDFAGVPLTRATYYIGMRDASFRPSDANTVPTLWIPDGHNGILVVGKTSAGGTVRVMGLIRPPYFASDGDPLTWLTDGDAWVVAEYMAAKYCESRASDGVMGPQAATHMQEYERGVGLLRELLSQEERALLLTFGDQGLAGPG